jgi:two-component system KDP operon response regulator KdpE
MPLYDSMLFDIENKQPSQDLRLAGGYATLRHYAESENMLGKHPRDSEHTNTVMIVEDEVFTQKLLLAALTSQGYRAYAFSSGEEGLRKFHAIHPDLVLLDIHLPGLDGLQVCRQLMQCSNVPIILVMGDSGEDNIVAGLEAGAAAYVTKPFSCKVLLARIKALLRQKSTASVISSTITYDDGYLQVDLVAHQVRVRGAKVRLTPTEFRILAYLLTKAGRICTARELLENVWGWEYHDSVDYLYTYIRRLRRKLEPHGGHSRYLLAEHGIGYWFQPQSTSSTLPRSDSAYINIAAIRRAL